MIRLINLHTFSRSKAGYDPVDGACWGWPGQYARALASSEKFANFAIESWSIDSELKQEERFEFNNVKFRIFPSRVWLSPGREQSLKLVDAIYELEREQLLLHLHSFFTWPTFDVIQRFHNRLPIIAHYHGAPLSPFLAPNLKRIAGLPIILAEQMAFGRAAHQVGTWLTTNEQDLRRLLDIQSATFCPMAPDVQVFSMIDRDLARKRLGLLDGKYLLFAGGFAQIKNLDLVLNAMPRVLKETPINLLIVGPTLEPSYELAMRRKIKQLDLQSSVQIIGRVDQKNLNDYYNAADLLLVSSFPGEGMPTTLLEALAVGLPVVATPIGIVPYAAKRTSKQVFVAQSNPSAYASTILSALQSTQSTRSPNILWTWEDVRRTVLPIYKKLAN